MAFNANGMQIGRSTYYDQTTGDMLTTHTYKSTDDTIADIVTNGYFPDDFGGSTGQVLLGDIVEIFSQVDLATVFYQVVTPEPIVLASLINFGSEVSGPGVSTDNALVRWNGTDGTSIQNSNVIIDDSGNITLDPFASLTLGGSGTLFVDNIDSAAPSANIVVGGGAQNASQFFVYPTTTLATNVLVSDIQAKTAEPIVIGGGSTTAVSITKATGFTVGLTLLTTGGTPATLDYYETGTFDITWTGALTSTETVRFQRLGKSVTLNFPSHTAVAAAGSTATAAAAVATRLRPALAAPSQQTPGEDNSAAASVTLTVESNGNLTVGVGAGSSAFTNSAPCGYFDTSITYLTA